MKEKLKKLEQLLRGDSNPKWQLTLELLTEIVNNLNDKKTTDTSQKKTESTDKDDLFDKVENKINEVFKQFEKRADGFWERLDKLKTKWS